MITLIIIFGILFIIILCVDKYIIPNLKPDNKLIKWWKRHIVEDDPDHL